MIPEANIHPAEQDTGTTMEHGGEEAVERGSGERGAGGYGVVARADRDEHGRLLPGHRIQPLRSGPPGGRKWEAEYLAMMHDAMPPETLRRHIELWAQQAKLSWRANESLVRFIMEYQVGKPKQRIDVTRTNFEVLLATLQQPVTVDATVADDADDLTKEPFS